ncbi:MAG: hypothetical protein LC687_05205 [Actinobacteria bacterium]|nr:hypothetical protein [Actinomycetota bacterium]
MIALSELLKDPVYKEYFLAVPKFRTKALRKPKFRVYVQLKGETVWRGKDAETYPEAFQIIKKYLKAGTLHDGAICCKSHASNPPMRNVRLKGQYKLDSKGKKVQVTKRVVWQAKLDGNDPDYQRWCPYCRRPTAFKYFVKHHALNYLGDGMSIDPELRRCVICGSSERLIDGTHR